MYTGSEAEHETDDRVTSDLLQAAEVLRTLAKEAPLPASATLPERETRNNLELVRVFERVTGAGLRPGVGKAAVQRHRARKRYTTRKDLDTGRRVQVLWIPFDFPKFKRAKQHDLRPFIGRVVQHEPGRGAKTHRVLYNDKTLAWHAVDQLKFLES